MGSWSAGSVRARMASVGWCLGLGGCGGAYLLFQLTGAPGTSFLDLCRRLRPRLVARARARRDHSPLQVKRGPVPGPLRFPALRRLVAVDVLVEAARVRTVVTAPRRRDDAFLVRG